VLRFKEGRGRLELYFTIKGKPLIFSLFSSSDVTMAVIAAPEEKPTMPLKGPFSSRVSRIYLMDLCKPFISSCSGSPYPQTR
jgi:hypothetical protein